MTAIRYRAFLSYSHRDTAWAKWLHRALEGYRIDKDLVGRETTCGPVPKTLRPIFRDREDFSAGHSLNEQTIAALEASQFVIAICSPNAARSKYVNEEIRHFKARGGSARVIPLIVDGEPGDAQHECFPPAIRFKLGTGGEVTDEREEPIAADARPQGDGKEIAKQKIVAGLLGVGLDEIMRRAARARKRRNRFRIAAVSAIALVIASAAVGWTGALMVSSRLDSTEMLGIKSDLADQCVEASNQATYYKVAEARRIALAVKCVGVLSYGLDQLPQSAYVPLRFVDSFQANVAILQAFQDSGKLTPQQAQLLNKAQRVLTALRKRLSAT
jgi:hypothetical protein